LEVAWVLAVGRGHFSCWRYVRAQQRHFSVSVSGQRVFHQEGHLPMDRIITHVLPLSSFQEGLGLVTHGEASIKVVLDPRLPCADVTVSAPPPPHDDCSPELTDSACGACCDIPTGFRLKDSVVWVTGSSRGIGRATAESTDASSCRCTAYCSRQCGCAY
jgi:hypothetical protein